jgi:hypothetical protein
MAKAHWTMNMHEGERCKTGSVRGRILVGGGGWMHKVKECEYGPFTLHTCLMIEHWCMA